jgi:hypothetical protein
MKKSSCMIFSFVVFITLFLAGCDAANNPPNSKKPETETKQTRHKQHSSRIIHVFVALCDNVNQGIVKVPAAIGNGQDAANYLYWGAAYGVKSFFKKQTDWTMLKSSKQTGMILERCIFKHKTADVYLIADAYDGAQIKQSTINFLKSCAGGFDDFVVNGKDTLYCGGNADLLAIVGHNGLMDFSINEQFTKANNAKRDAVILACISKKYFSSHIRHTGANPLLWSNGLMSPEAYTLKAAVDGWIKKENGAQTRKRAATAYNQYQKCGMKGAINLLATGW